MKFNLKEWRDNNKLTQEEAAKELLISHDTISRIENGYKPKRTHLIEVACKFYDENNGKYKAIINKYKKVKK